MRRACRGTFVMLALLRAMTFAVPAAAAPDDGAHLRDASESWRVAGHLRAASGRRFDYTLTVFRFATPAPTTNARENENSWAEGTFFAATLGVVDESEERFSQSDRFARAALGIGSAATQTLALRVADWSIARMRSDAIEVRASNADATLALTNVPDKPAIRFRDGESVTTSLRATGTLHLGKRTYAVSGASWFDHAFGERARARGAIGWDRFCIQLDDGRDFLFAVDRSRGTGVATVVRATLVDARGKRRDLSPSEYRLRAHGPAGWRSLHTGARYPSIWALDVPREDLQLSLEPVLADQEFTFARGVPYWDGAVDVYDVRPWSAGRRLGSGYVELTGYAGAVEL